MYRAPAFLPFFAAIAAFAAAQEDDEPQLSTSLSVETLTQTISQEVTHVSSGLTTVTSISTGSVLIAGGGGPQQGYFPVTTTVEQVSGIEVTNVAMEPQTTTVSTTHTFVLTLTESESGSASSSVVSTTDDPPATSEASADSASSSEATASASRGNGDEHGDVLGVKTVYSTTLLDSFEDNHGGGSIRHVWPTSLCPCPLLAAAVCVWSVA